MGKSARDGLVALSLCLAVPLSFAAATSFTEPPTLVADPAGMAPLTAEIGVKTDAASQVTLRVTDGIDLWTVKYPDFATEHVLPLFGLKPGRTYSIEVTLTPGGETDSSLTLTTPELPADFPGVQPLHSEPAEMQPGFTLLDNISHGRGDPRPRYTVILDAYGDVVWFSPLATGATGQGPEGQLVYRCGQRVCEADLFGRQTVIVDLADPGDGLHHDLFETVEGTYLSLSRRTIEIENFPTSETDPAAPPATTTVRDEPIVEFAADGSLLNEWSLTDIIDPIRIGYDSLFDTSGGVDWVHTNAVVHDTSDNSILVSVRHQDAVVKFSRTTGELIWILGPHANWTAGFQPFLFTPVGAPFEWQYHQHAPLITPDGNIMLFDNGNFRASPFDGQVPYDARTPLDNYSRAVEFAIDEEAMEIEQVWEYGSDIDEILYASFVSDVDWLDNGNILIDFGGTRVMGGVTNIDLGYGDVTVRIVEVTHETPARRVFDVLVYDPEAVQAIVYRAERIPSLYHPDVMVASLGPIAVGSVPDGAGVPGTPLTLDKGEGEDLALAWGRSCLSSDLDYAIYEGTLGDYGSHEAAACSTLGATSRTISPRDGDRFYLVVPTNGADEGSYGTSSAGAERVPATEACLTQALAACL